MAAAPRPSSTKPIYSFPGKLPESGVRCCWLEAAAAAAAAGPAVAGVGTVQEERGGGSSRQGHTADSTGGRARAEKATKPKRMPMQHSKWSPAVKAHYPGGTQG